MTTGSHAIQRSSRLSSTFYFMPKSSGGSPIHAITHLRFHQYANSLKTQQGALDKLSYEELVAIYYIFPEKICFFIDVTTMTFTFFSLR